MGAKPQLCYNQIINDRVIMRLQCTISSSTGPVKNKLLPHDSVICFFLSHNDLTSLGTQISIKYRFQKLFELIIPAINTIFRSKYFAKNNSKQHLQMIELPADSFLVSNYFIIL